MGRYNIPINQNQEYILSIRQYIGSYPRNKLVMADQAAHNKGYCNGMHFSKTFLGINAGNGIPLHGRFGIENLEFSFISSKTRFVKIAIN